MPDPILWWRTLAGAALITISPLGLAGLQAQGTTSDLAPAPEAATGRTPRAGGQATERMVAAANPLAARAGLEILRGRRQRRRRGDRGPARAQPGRAAELRHRRRRLHAPLGRGPTRARHPRRPRDRAGRGHARPLPRAGRQAAWSSWTPSSAAARSACPGTVRLLEEAHQRWGRLPWAQLFEPAIRLAEDGFADLAAPQRPLVAGGAPRRRSARRAPISTRRTARPRRRHAPDEPGLRRDPARASPTEGADAFYTGEIAQDIVATVTGHPTNPGDMTLADLAGLPRRGAASRSAASTAPTRSAAWARPARAPIAVQQILGVLETTDMAAPGPGPEAVHWFSEAGRLAFADRALLSRRPRLRQRAGAGPHGPRLPHGAAPASSTRTDPWARPRPAIRRSSRAALLAPSDGIENGTSHISVVDARRQRGLDDDDDRGRLRRARS